jgi:hypothetical protein
LETPPLPRPLVPDPLVELLGLKGPPLAGSVEFNRPPLVELVGVDRPPRAELFVMLPLVALFAVPPREAAP